MEKKRFKFLIDNETSKTMTNSAEEVKLAFLKLLNLNALFMPNLIYWYFLEDLLATSLVKKRRCEHDR